MDFRLGDDQELLVATARDFLRKHCPPELLDELAGDERNFPDHLWRAMAELGWTGLLVPAEYGGSEGSLLDVILLLEEMGRVCLPGPYLHSAVVATSLIATAGSDAQRRSLLPALVNGERRCALALLEESGELVAEAMTTWVDGDGLRGHKLFVKDAHLAHDLLVVARQGAGLTLILLESARPGLTVAPMPSMTDEKLFEVIFSEVKIHPGDVLGAPGQGADALAQAVRLGALGRSAEMLGCAQHILDLVVEHTKSRVQSGQPIGAFQAIQHACADLLRNVESARPLLYSAAWKVEQGQAVAPAVAMAKSYVGDTCLAVARKAHQVFGAISYCEEHPLHRFHKRIIAARLDFGEVALHQETIARAIGLSC
ncbi:MAG: acyl-CoA dehydrogenase family protein [Candidatus Rokuibacteriota bacterium]